MNISTENGKYLVSTLEFKLEILMEFTIEICMLIHQYWKEVSSSCCACASDKLRRGGLAG